MTSLKNVRNKSGSNARHLHYLKDIALDAFESRKAELRGNGKGKKWFLLLKLHIFPKLDSLFVSEIRQTEIRNTFAPSGIPKAATAEKVLNHLNICFKHTAALGFYVDLQATTKARAFSGKKLHKMQNRLAMDWKDFPAFCLDTQ